MTIFLAKGTIKRIHINQHVIRSNRQKGLADPPISIKTSKANHRGSTVDIMGPSTLVYRPDRPLDCGAHVWIETKDEVRIDTA